RSAPAWDARRAEGRRCPRRGPGADRPGDLLMDVNGTRFHPVLGRPDGGGGPDGTGRSLASTWGPSGRTDLAEVEWHDARGELTLRSLTPQVTSARGAPPPPPAELP